MRLFPFSKEKPMLDDESQHRVVACIQEAESKTSGEIRVFMEHRCEYMDAMHRAQELFAKLEMEKTEGRSAIIIYIALKDRQFALFGDVEIYNKAGGAAFWEAAAQQLKGHFRHNHITEGLCNCITELGKALATHFPHDPATKKNELPDEIVFGK